MAKRDINRKKVCCTFLERREEIYLLARGEKYIHERLRNGRGGVSSSIVSSTGMGCVSSKLDLMDEGDDLDRLDGMREVDEEVEFLRGG